ncbi:Hypothetical predicted protein [Podarcis lilfordi]|nr:Hypothetical predicted protein [Podarcis lilfordi]
MKVYFCQKSSQNFLWAYGSNTWWKKTMVGYGDVTHHVMKQLVMPPVFRFLHPKDQQNHRVLDCQFRNIFQHVRGIKRDILYYALESPYGFRYPRMTTGLESIWREEADGTI